MSKEFNLQTGKLGEEIAGEFLKKKGYKILEQNYKTKYGEIDLVMQRGKDLIAVEVRTKRGDMFGSPEESLTKKKLRKIWLNAQALRATRIDAVCITLKYNNEVERIEHYENIT